MPKQTTYLKDYTPPAYLIPEIRLEVTLDPKRTRVEAALRIVRNPASGAGHVPLILNGEGLGLERVAIDGRTLAEGEYSYADELLTIPTPLAGEFTLESVVHVNPADNTELDGLYLSAGNFCTQCEAEAFRKITFFADRPDVMSVYTVKIIGPKATCPVLLAGGNLAESGDLDGGLHYAVWHDPFPKPCCIFALVAGDLADIADSFTTMSGREVALHIYVEPRNAAKCGHAMAALKKAMRWDEERFGREYDLDNFKILAVDDFNMGAMENKGLNVFNSKYVLALPETATDADYEGIERVIGHEYFHNWTGNRVACRDWFQLSLKEGLTVFRDQEFTSDIGSRPVQRIRDVNVIRSLQFKEDAGPMAHPVRPAAYVEINNFYTVTVYDKGAEVIRMMHTLLGEAGFRKGMDLYFERHDGQSVTCDDFAAAMADANGRDLTAFKRWYSQAGTPEIFVDSRYDAANRRLHLKLRQTCPDTPDMPAKDKKPFVIPVALGLLGADGRDLDFTQGGQKNPPYLLLEEAEQEFALEGVSEKPLLSLLRGFSAPVKLHLDQSDEELALRVAHDSDPWAAWDAGEQLRLNIMLKGLAARARGEAFQPPALFSRSFGALLDNEAADPAYLAAVIPLPTENWIGQHLTPLDPVAVFTERSLARAYLGRDQRERLLRRYHAMAPRGPYRYDHEGAGRRALRNACLSYLLAVKPGGRAEPEMLALGERQYREADNMTEALSALASVVNADRERGDALLADFHDKWRQDPLVMDKWLALQATCALPGTLERVRELLRHPVFSIKNPNKVRALVGAFCAQNQGRFHSPDGAGYDFLHEMLLRLDDINPQISARMAAPLTQWRRYDAARQKLMRERLESLALRPGLSDDLKELVEKSLAAG